MQQHHPPTPLLQGRRPRQQPQAAIADHAEQGLVARLLGNGRQRLCRQHQLPDHAAAFGNELPAAIIPLNDILGVYQLRQDVTEAGGVEHRGTVDTVGGFPLVAADLRHRQPLAAYQRVLCGQHGTAPVAQLVLAAVAGAAHTGDAIRIRAGQQYTEYVFIGDRDTVLARLVHRLRYLPIAPRLLPGALEPALQVVRTGQLAHQQRDGDPDIDAAIRQWVAFRQHRGQQAGGLRCVDIAADQQHVRQPRMQGQLGQTHAMGGQLPAPGRTLEGGATGLQRGHGLGKRSRGRRIQPAQLGNIVHAPGEQLQRQRRQIGLQYLGRTVRDQLLVLLLTPQPITVPRAEPPRPAGALLGGGARQSPGGEAGHAGGRVEHRLSHQAAVDHRADALDSEAGLGDIGRQDNLATPGRRRSYRPLLLFQ